MKTFHIVYLIVAIILVVTSSILLRNVKKETRTKILKYTSIATLVVHLSLIWTVFFSPDFNFHIGSLASTIWPIFPCNLIMILLPITFSLKKPIKILYPFVTTLAIVGGLMTIIFPEFHTSTTMNWAVLRSYLSHTLMLFVGLYAIVSSEYKPKIKDLISISVGSVLSIAFGHLTIFMFDTLKHQSVNAMFIKQPAISGTILNIYVLLVLYLLAFTAFALIYNLVENKRKAKEINKK